MDGWLAASACQCCTGVRLVHIPTGLAVKCTEHRTQQQNRATALERLTAKLLVVLEEQQAAALADIRGDIVKAEWGQQIRNYVFHPYKLVKDTRTGLLLFLVEAEGKGTRLPAWPPPFDHPVFLDCVPLHRLRDQRHWRCHGWPAGRLDQQLPAPQEQAAAGGAADPDAVRAVVGVCVCCDSVPWTSLLINSFWLKLDAVASAELLSNPSKPSLPVSRVPTFSFVSSLITFTRQQLNTICRRPFAETSSALPLFPDTPVHPVFC